MQRPIASNAFYKIEIRFMPDSRNKKMGTERNILISFSKSKVNPRNYNKNQVGKADHLRQTTSPVDLI